jgi:hypothetical protein
MRIQKAAMPSPTVKAGQGTGGAPVSTGYGLKHKLRKGTEFQGMSPGDTGVGDLMSDYARVMAAKGGV